MRSQTPPAINRWIVGARPRTLPAAIVPVVVGTAVAAHDVDLTWWRAALALLVALGLQVGTNYANDYSDGVRGTDDRRVGPLRLVASGLASARAVKFAALISFAVAALAGAVLAFAVEPLLLVVGASCLLAGWFYTGGRSPYGYRGFGELAVFVFFGLVAVCGTQYVLQEQITASGLAAGSAVGSLAVSLLVVNNLRDRSNDAAVGKKTLAVRLGDKATRRFYVVCILAPFVVSAMFLFSRPWVALTLLSVPLAASVNRIVRRGASGPELIGVLQHTGRLQLVFGALFAVGLSI